ncbi:hypothetical protein [Clostridium guangxiense]|uniref:hypothetical protein n=1 Tax=Clostridium guangxiense TaxID=1662055 RepID=UPI001E29C072|nr:hypothetical protein [Clostridium guangxiense]MCD2347169.1 hypothetical protein [Clostridium guangxiense]
MESIYVDNKEGIEVCLIVGRNYIIIYRKDGIQYKASGVIYYITKGSSDLGYTTVDISKIEDVIGINKETSNDRL